MIARFQGITFEQAFPAIVSLVFEIMAVILARMAFEGAGMVGNMLLRSETYGAYSAALALKTLLFSQCFSVCAVFFLIPLLRKVFFGQNKKLGS